MKYKMLKFESSLMNLRLQSDSPRQRGRRNSYFIIFNLVLIVVAGCASDPRYRAYSELPQKKASFRSMGLLPSILTVYQEQAGYKLVSQEGWSRDAEESIRAAFIEEAANEHFPVTVVNLQYPEADEISGLFSALDYSISRHAYSSPEKFPEGVSSRDYSVGPVGDLMDRYHLDALWLVGGLNLIPTTGTKIQDALGVAISIASGLGSRGGGAVYIGLKKLELRAALVDRSGKVLFYCRIDDDYFRTVQNLESSAIGKGDQKAAIEWPDNQDLRDRKTARLYIRALLAEYAKAARP